MGTTTLVGTVRVEDLGSGPPPEDVLAFLAAEPGLACLWGRWASTGVDGAVLIMSRPNQISRDVRDLDRQPWQDTAGSGPVGADVVGGGWVGWLGYDAPAYLAYYDHLLRWDQLTRRWSFQALWSPARAHLLATRRDELRAALQQAGRPDGKPTWRLGEFSGPNHERHLRAVEEAIGLIRAGEIYQVNVCTRLHARFEGSAANLFAQAVTRLRPAYGAFIDAGDRTVLSLSPELFLQRVGTEVLTSPIKGTWARDPGDPDDDGARRLRNSTKDVAENVMIVDLMRNDVGRVSSTG